MLHPEPANKVSAAAAMNASYTSTGASVPEQKVPARKLSHSDFFSILVRLAGKNVTSERLVNFSLTNFMVRKSVFNFRTQIDQNVK